MAKACAAAKINLSLHVTARRSDGYHLLDSVVMFADVGDTVTLDLSEKMQLEVTGPMSDGVPTDNRNLVLKAANLMEVKASILLEKHLPNAAGIGGGSSDAGTVLRLLSDLTRRPVPEDGLSLGADIPVCLLGRAARMQGIGDQITPLPGMPTVHAVLVNPRVPVPTGAVFQNLKSTNNSGMRTPLPHKASATDLILWLQNTRNDLQEPAMQAQPVIGQVLDDISAMPTCQLARMSGSGATCFGLYHTAREAREAAHLLTQAHPSWWIVPTQLS